MAYTITLSDEEFETLAAEAERTGESIEALAHAAVQARYTPTQAAEQEQSKPKSVVDPHVEYMYHAGHLLRLPSGKFDLLDEEEKELERLANSVKPGKSAADMVIEDRGPR